jgi:hypothetical protein
MFDQARYIQNSFSITFNRYSAIRRKANEFEDLLNSRFDGHYSQPQVIPIPDELDPEMPRMIFGSKHGFSQIIISQLNMTLNVTYSPDWQIDIRKGKEYLKERSSALFSLLGLLGDVPVFFSGLSTRVQLPTTEEEISILLHLKDCYGIPLKDNDLHDIQVRIVNIHNDKFYNNITIQNYRNWAVTGANLGTPRLARHKASKRGVEIISDFNDRFAFNEQAEYLSSHSVADEIINEGLSQVNNAINDVIRGSI